LVTVLLAAAPSCFDSATADDLAALSPRAIPDQTNSRHMVLDESSGAHRLWYLDPAPGRPLGVLIPLDADFRMRLDAALRLHRRLTGAPAGPLPRGWRLTAMQRRRLILMLRALDGRQAGASYRDIALALLDAREARWPACDWKCSAARSYVIRLVADAIALMNGGYRKLLRGR
jgi:hypothetical protein